ncbi:mitochondrial assembly of ribosomal large subunit protein 1-like [Dendronephthya gigantea]|uniref:mitochondrial assembly of ribosomal large subunit protein 1-like n=1 Tax=Dendronephthya gigantea TaxID=151771 RepID=UPI00106BA1D9|nr:mitochondrial assembly of ribosomal large subunit protein 1-like [Dendronephthya gigantea]
MLTQRSFSALKTFLNKSVSNLSRNRLNSSFSNENVWEMTFKYSPYCLNSIGVNTKPLTAFNTWRNTSNRFYSGDPSITFLSGGRSKHFEASAVYDEDKLLKNIVKQLKEDNGVDICVIETSEERRKYADYVVVVSGRSTRHLKAMTNHIHQKSKKDFAEKHVFVTGLDSNDWMIVDFNSIVIHLFLPEIREKYDLEKLWSLGPEQDKQYQEMLEDDRYAEMVKNAKLEDFFVNEESNK